MKVVGHKTVCVVGAVTSYRSTLIIIMDTHTIESRNELIIVFRLFEDILMINATHHHMKLTEQ